MLFGHSILTVGLYWLQPDSFSTIFYELNPGILKHHLLCATDSVLSTFRSGGSLKTGLIVWDSPTFIAPYSIVFARSLFGRLVTQD